MTECEGYSEVGSAAVTGAEQAYVCLRRAIMDGRLAPGATVSQVAMAQQMGLSRTPLREAVRMLQREGLVDGGANRMLRVATLSYREVEELYAMRIANEALAIRLTVSDATHTDDHFLLSCLDRLNAHTPDGGVESWEREHRFFHMYLVHGGGRRLCALLSDLYDHTERCRRLYITSNPRAMSMGAVEHEAIVQAVRERDAARAAAELARHLSRTALATLLDIAPEHEPAMIRDALRLVLDQCEGNALAAPSPRQAPAATVRTR